METPEYNTKRHRSFTKLAGYLGTQLVREDADEVYAESDHVSRTVRAVLCACFVFINYRRLRIGANLRIRTWVGGSRERKPSSRGPRVKNIACGAALAHCEVRCEPAFMLELDWLVCASGFFGHASGFIGPTAQRIPY